MIQTNPIYQPEYYEFLYEKSSRNRILVIAKTLFASLGYDNTSTALIARNAGTSESQLVKHFGGKAGLLEAMFSEGWDKVNAQLEALFAASLKSEADLNSRLACIPEVVFRLLDADVELKTLILLESHRMRQTAVRTGLVSGYGRFLDTVARVIARARAEGQFHAAVPPACVRSAIVGILEGGIRDQALAARASFPANFTADDCSRLIRLFLRKLATGGDSAHAWG
jgi:AcrR family transcriptional regulator